MESTGVSSLSSWHFVQVRTASFTVFGAGAGVEPRSGSLDRSEAEAPTANPSPAIHRASAKIVFE
jgi:hypothetical protein